MTDGNPKDSTKPLLTDRSYAIVKQLVQVILPALVTLFIFIAETLSYDDTAKVAGIATAVTGFLGVVLKAASTRYYNNDNNYDGNLTVVPVDGQAPELLLALNEEHATTVIPNKKEVTFKVILN